MHFPHPHPEKQTSVPYTTRSIVGHAPNIMFTTRLQSRTCCERNPLPLYLLLFTSQKGAASLRRRSLLDQLHPEGGALSANLPVSHGFHAVPRKQQHLEPIVPLPRFVWVIHLARDIHQCSWPGSPFPEPRPRRGGNFLRHRIFSPRSRVSPGIVVLLAHVSTLFIRVVVHDPCDRKAASDLCAFSRVFR